MRARKRFGQNFLHDQNLISKIVNTINPQSDQHILEIGPGHGALTRLLIASNCHLDVIEIDRDLAAELRLTIPQINVIEADILDFDFTQLPTDQRLRVVGNLPYNISTPLIFKLFENLDNIQDMHFMLQLEVVNRITADPSTPDYGRLSVMSQYCCQADKLFAVPPDAFVPRPKVTSAIVRLLPKESREEATDLKLFEKIVAQAFSMRRKTIRNSLKGFIDDSGFLALDLDQKSRAENLTLQNYIDIANYSTKQAS